MRQNEKDNADTGIGMVIHDHCAMVEFKCYVHSNKRISTIHISLPIINYSTGILCYCYSKRSETRVMRDDNNFVPTFGDVFVRIRTCG